MTVQIAVGIFLIVHALAGYLLRASGAWQVMFAPMLPLAPDKTPDPLRVAPRGWIENHAFWDLGSDDDSDGDAASPEEVFWGHPQRDVG